MDLATALKNELWPAAKRKPNAVPTELIVGVLTAVVRFDPSLCRVRSSSGGGVGGGKTLTAASAGIRSLVACRALAPAAGLAVEEPWTSRFVTLDLTVGEPRNRLGT